MINAYIKFGYPWVQECSKLLSNMATKESRDFVIKCRSVNTEVTVRFTAVVNSLSAHLVWFISIYQEHSLTQHITVSNTS